MERLAKAYLRAEGGNTTLLHYLSNKYILHLPTRSAVEALRFYESVHNNKHSNKGDFKLIKPIENKINKELDQNILKFTEILDIAKIVFSSNILSNDTQKRLEEAITAKLELKVEVDLSKLTNLVVKMKNYQIKSENFISSLFSYLQITAGVNKSEFAKLLGKLSEFLYSLAKNANFCSQITSNPDSSRFIGNLLAIVLNNLKNYKGRELIYILVSLRILKVLDNQNESVLVKEIQLDSLSNSDKVKLSQFLLKSDQIHDETILNLVDMLLKSHSTLLYKDLLWTVTFLIENQYLPQSQYLPNLLSFTAKRLNPILNQIEISDLASVIALFSKFDFNSLEQFVKNCLSVLEKRINEVPKDKFASCLASLVEHSHWSAVEKMFEILHEVSKYGDISDVFGGGEDANNIYWAYWTAKNRDVKVIEELEDKILLLRNDIFALDPANLDSARSAVRLVQSVLLEACVKGNIQESIEELKSKFLSNLDETFKETLISQDAAGKVSEQVADSVFQGISAFFKEKPNCNINSEVVDDLLNLISFAVDFEIPELKSGETIKGVDNNRFAVLLESKASKIGDKRFSIYQNREILLKKALGWEVKVICESEWTEMSEQAKIDCFRTFFDIDMDKEENKKIQLEIEHKTTSKPMFKLTQDVIKKK